MREFIRLQLKLKWGFNRNNNKASAIMTALATLFAVILVLALVWALSYVLRASLEVTTKQLAQLFLTLIMVGLTVVATGMQTRRLYRPGDLLITARFPLSPFKLFAGYLILNYIDLSIYSAILLLPVMIVFGLAMHCLTAAYLLGVLLGVLLMPMIPFALSIFIAVPAVSIMSLLERHGIVRLIVFILFLVGAFALYYYLLTVLSQFFIHRNWETGTLEIWEGLLRGLDAYYNPAYYLGNVIFFERFALGLGVYLAVSALLIACGVALARTVSANFRMKALNGGNGIPPKHTEIDNYKSGFAIFRNGIKEIMRTKTYSYFYLGVAISTPVMVFFCNRLVTMVGEAQIGSGINFGASMLVVAVFMAMICSFTGTVLSVEGKNFYITKLVPVSFRKQLLIKGFLNIGVSAVALLISAAVIWGLEFVNGAELGVLVASQLILATGLVFNGINLNLANPNLKPKANGEAEEINITYMLIIGLVIAAIMGACTIIFPRVIENGKMMAYLIAVSVALIYAGVNIIVFGFTAQRKYQKIEV